MTGRLDPAELVDLLGTLERGGENASVQETTASGRQLFGVMRQVLKSQLEGELAVIEKGLVELGVDPDIKL